MQVAEALRDNPLIAAVEIAGLGFINMRVSRSALATRANEISADPNAGAPAPSAAAGAQPSGR